MELYIGSEVYYDSSVVEKIADGRVPTLAGTHFVLIEPEYLSMPDRIFSIANEIVMSYGVIVGDKIIVNEGPLAGHEAIIKKIDRHKRSALISIPMFSRTVDVSIGLEIVSKT